MKSHLRRFPLWAATTFAWVGAAGFSGAWEPGTSAPLAVDGFTVDRTDRRDVLAFYQCVYKASEDYATHHGWLGNATTCTAGTTSVVFKNDVLRRVNFFRALTGLPADIYFTAAKSAKAQKSALMMAKAGALDHFPTALWPCYTVDGAAAAGAGNLSLGNYGPAAIDGYIHDEGVNNRPVGHRRWILYPRAKEMGTGDIPAHSTFLSANTLWVMGEFKAAPAAAFSAWPSHGFFPFPLMPARWSLSYPGANFASATVAMTVGGAPVPVTIVSRTDNGIGDNTIVWEPSSLPLGLSGNLACTVVVAGIGGGGPTSRTYTVTLFDPEVLGESVSIVGTSSPSVAGQAYTFNPIEQADEYELEVASLDTEPWTEGAENAPAPRIEESVAAGYSPRQSMLIRTGSKAFQLTFPDGVFTDQSFEITRDFVPAVGSRLRFHDRARFSSLTTTLLAQVTSDDGASWTTLFSRTGVGGSSDLWDDSWIARDIDLSAYAGKVIRVRFLMTRNGGSVFQGVSDSNGFFIDDISVTGARQLVNSTKTILAAGSTSFTLGTTTAGAPLLPNTAYAMRIRPNVGCRWFEYGSVRMVRSLVSEDSPDIAIEKPSGADLADGASPVALGNVSIGKTVTRTFTILNKGQARLKELAIEKSGAHKEDFVVKGPVATKLAPGASTTFQVSFKPRAKDLRTAKLKIISNDPDENPFDIALSGKGLPAPDIAVVSAAGKNLISGKATVGIGDIAIGKSITHTFTIRNTGKGALRGLVISKTGTHPADFSVKPPINKSLAPGASATFQVIFKPKAKGTRSAALKIASNDPDERPFTIRMTGTSN